MATKYLYIDDESNIQLEPFITALTGRTDELEIVLQAPKELGDQIDEFSSILNNYDGLILDWRLDQLPNQEGRRVRFRAAALAQELRTRATETRAGIVGGAIRDLPIVLWSTYEKLKGSYYGDDTSHDLFDYKQHKQRVVEDSERVRVELVSLAKGYREIAEKVGRHNSFPEIVLTEDQRGSLTLDPRIAERFISIDSTPYHELAKFILKELILRPGPLISEELLAARLGINKEASSGWRTFLRTLPDNSRYQGPFRDAWPRWWAQVIEKDWWQAMCHPRSLSLLRAPERVERLIQCTGISDLVAATPISPTYQDRYWTVCEYSTCPLDPIDGVTIVEKEPEPWQERRYISLRVALERLWEHEDPRPHPSERERLRELI